ncbi:MAG TPA: hypothetical protein V6C65_11310, partial [Allocoleopsis sp.]
MFSFYSLIPSSLQRSSGYLLMGLVAIEAFMALTYLGSIAIFGQVYPLVDFDGQGTLPSLLQALHFFTIGLLILWLLVQPRSRFPYPSRPFLIAFALLMAYATLDELFKIHLHLKPLLAGHDWKWFYLSGFGALMLGC